MLLVYWDKPEANLEEDSEKGKAIIDTHKTMKGNKKTKVKKNKASKRKGKLKKEKVEGKKKLMKIRDKRANKQKKKNY